MDASASEWSSGCESGWTGYLDESSPSPNQYQRGSRRSGHDHNHGYRPNYQQEEEDLSMISDASSGPPNFHNEEEEEEIKSFQKDGFLCPPPVEKGAKKKKAKETRGKNQWHSYLDDTASSPALSGAKKFMDASNNHPGVLQSSHSKRQDPAEPSLFRGRRRG